MTDWERSTRPIGDAIQAWRKTLGFTRQQAADALGVPLDTMSGWIHDKAKPSQEMMVRKLMTYIEREQAGK